MCEPLSILAGVSAVSGIAGTVTSTIAGNKQTKAANIQATANNAANAENYVDQTNYNDDVWEQDIEYGYKTLAYEQDAVARQSQWAGEAVKTVQQNTQVNMGQAILRSVQQNMADTLGVITANANAEAKQSSLQAGADGRGVQGNSVDSIIQDVQTQNNEDAAVMQLNRSAQNQQARIDVASAKASGDSSLASIQGQYRIYQPQTPIREAAPVGMAAVQQQQGTSALGTALTIGGQVAQGAGNVVGAYSKSTGIPVNQVVSSLASKIGL